MKEAPLYGQLQWALCFIFQLLMMVSVGREDSLDRGEGGSESLFSRWEVVAALRGERG